MLLPYAKFASFFIVAVPFHQLTSRISFIHDLSYVTGLAIAFIYISWQVSRLLLHVYNSSKETKTSSDSKCVLITGCDTGFGHAMALQLNQSGFSVFAGCLFRDLKEAQSLVTKCKYPSKMHLLGLNVRSKGDVDEAYSKIEDHTQKTGEHLYALINNAGISGWGPLEWGSMEHDVEPVVDVDLTSVMKITRTFLPMLKQSDRSRVLFMTSYVTNLSVPFIATYVVSKRGVKAFADALRAEVNAEPKVYNNMKILNVEPTAYKTGLLGYDVASRAVDVTWCRTSDRVKQDYGHRIYEAFKAFISVCKFFEFLDFVAVRSDLSEVAVVVDHLLQTKDPISNDTAVMPFYSQFFIQLMHDYVPDEVLECVFHFLAMQGLIFSFIVSIIKNLFRM